MSSKYHQKPNSEDDCVTCEYAGDCGCDPQDCDLIYFSDDPEREYLDYSFRDPGGRSALRMGELKHSCPTCGRPNMLTDADKRLGYQCDYCADALEGLRPSAYY